MRNGIRSRMVEGLWLKSMEKRIFKSVIIFEGLENCNLELVIFVYGDGLVFRLWWIILEIEVFECLGEKMREVGVKLLKMFESKSFLRIL